MPSMALVVICGTTVVDRFAKNHADSTTVATSIAEGAIKAVQVVQAFDAFDALTTDHKHNLTKAMRFGIWKAIASAVILGCIYFVA